MSSTLQLVAARDPAPNDPTTLSATAMADSIRRGEASSVELVEACLHRIETVNPALNAVVQLCAETARLEARAADAARASGEALGPLHGVPVTVKDSFDVRGVISTGGTLGRRAYVPAQDASAVARLRAAGAIVLGKTNVPELSLAFESDNLVYGRTNNPYDLARTPGGSSGGEAAIIAAGGSPLGIGTDAAGSLRVPAHCCGIAALKPTLGRVPRSGMFPPAVGAIADLWHVGPLARRVDDLSLALSVLAGPDGYDPRVAPVPLDDPRRVEPAQQRIACFADNGILSPTPETEAGVRFAAEALRGAGARVDQARPDAIEQTLDLTRAVFGADGGAGGPLLLQLAGTTQPSPLLLRLAAVLEPAYARSAADCAAVLARWDVFRATMLAFWHRFDALVCPVNAYPAPPHGTTFDDDHLPGFSYTMAFNLTGWPVVVVRAGTSAEGLPIGVQVVAPPWREAVALALARQIEAAFDRRA